MEKEITENMMIFQKMVNVSNSSLSTQQLCWNICDALGDDAKEKFFKWLIVIENKISEVRNDTV